MTAWLLVGVTWAFPVRKAPERPAEVGWTEGRDPQVLVVKLAEEQGLAWGGAGLVGPGDLRELNGLLAGAEPLFSRDPRAIRADRETWDPEHRLASLDLYLVVRSAGAVALGTRLLADPRVETAYLAREAVPPPEDLPPTTPDFSDLQGYLGPAPDGFGFDEAAAWPGGRGENVALADVEYGWVEDHEDLEAAVGSFAWGRYSGFYEYHGSSVLGEIVGGDNGYGVLGMAPDVEILMVSPYDESGSYRVADAIDGAAALLDAGDVLLIEQQALEGGVYCPVEVDPAVFDVIALAVAKGVVVVEPAGNGACNLDDDGWDGWFDRAERDSGAIMVGGGASPLSGYLPREWYPFGSCYGSRVDVQGWFDGIVTATSGEYGESLADLYYPDEDGRQAYTQSFGGTSGASPMVAAAAAVANSVAWNLWGQPWDPWDLRTALVTTGTPQAANDGPLVGPQPDVRQLLRTWGVR